MVLVKTKSSLGFIIKSHLLSEFLTYLIKKLLSIRENLKQMLRYLLLIWGDADEYSACHASLRTRVLSPESGEMSHTDPEPHCWEGAVETGRDQWIQRSS